MFRVSRLLAMGGLVDPSWYTQDGRDRGHVVHMAAEAVFTNQQTVSVAPVYTGYVTALQAAHATLAFVALCVERRLCALGTTGRPDAIGYLTARTGNLWPGPVIIDVKSGSREVPHGVQLALYEMLADACGLRDLLPAEYRDLPWQRVGLYVAANGSYRIHPYADPDDFTIAHALLDLTRWRVKHGLVKFDDDDPDLMEELAHGITRDGTGDGAGSEQPASGRVQAAGAGAAGTGGGTGDHDG